MTAVSTPRELDDLLEQLGKVGFLWWHFPAAADRPEVLAGVYQYPHAETTDGTCDVVVLHHDELAHAYRAPAGPLDEVFRPAQVWWWYGGPPDQTIRALLALPQPGVPGAPGTLMPLPAGTGVAGDLAPVRVHAPRWTAARRHGTH